ncbi:MAG: hypothetical protein ACRC41_00915, partial [Sarcina sp.]
FLLKQLNQLVALFLPRLTTPFKNLKKHKNISYLFNLPKGFPIGIPLRNSHAQKNSRGEIPRYLIQMYGLFGS